MFGKASVHLDKVRVPPRAQDGCKDTPSQRLFWRGQKGQEGSHGAENADAQVIFSTGSNNLILRERDDIRRLHVKPFQN